MKSSLDLSPNWTTSSTLNGTDSLWNKTQCWINKYCHSRFILFYCYNNNNNKSSSNKIIITIIIIINYNNNCAKIIKESGPIMSVVCLTHVISPDFNRQISASWTEPISSSESSVLLRSLLLLQTYMHLHLISCRILI